MSDEQAPSFIDRAVKALAGIMDGLGLNGSRLLWKWNQRRKQLGELNLKQEMLWRSAKGRHKMCPECRALVPRQTKVCPECNAALGAVRAPGVGRVASNLFPGASSAASLILLVNGFWFVLMLLAQTRLGQGGGLFSSFGGEMLVDFGSGLSRPRALSDGTVTGGEWWRVVTPIFLHGGLIHFGFNSMCLLNLAPALEEVYGTARFWVIYLTCGLAGSLASQLPKFVNTVGASGAIFGMIGILIVFGIRNGSVMGIPLKQFLIRIALMVLVLSLAFGGRLDHANHFGGLVWGLFMGFAIPERESSSRLVLRLWNIAAIAGVLLVLYAFYEVARYRI